MTVRSRPTRDPDILRTLLGLHALPCPRILDATYGHGRIWRGLPYRPTRLDVNPELDLDVVGQWQDVGRLFGACSFDVVVWDPIHVTDVGDSGVLSKRYSARAPHHLKGNSIASLYGPFLEAARAVLQPKVGVVIAKIADQVHNSSQQWQLVELVLAAHRAGFRPCDYAIKQRPSAIDDPKWQMRYHVRKTHAFWVVLRNGPSCVGPGIGLVRVCPVCKIAFRPRRRHAKTCSDRCRQQLHRRRDIPLSVCARAAAV